MRNRTLRALGLLSMVAAPAFACKCEVFSTCNEVAATNLIFIGTVESIDPVFLNRWNPGSKESLKELNDAYLSAQQNPTADLLGRLKDAYRKTFPDVSADRQRQLQAAKTPSAVASLFYAGMGSGMHIRFKVQTLFKHADDDDDPKKPDAKDDDKKHEEFFDISTPFGDCGYSFQVGETYLVYASDDEEASSGPYTDSCTRTRRLSDAGEDLAYLFFYKNHPEAAGRVEGFVTSDPKYRVGFDPMHPELLKSPAGDLVVELTSESLTRFAEADRNGRFVFDGLPEGDYKLWTYGREYPLDQRPIAGPQALHLEEKSCARPIVVVPEEIKK